ncbi:MAG: hypothetical protein HFH68_13790 [Lachnospiraceae bacterium]|nr:hypothetical protein [Lachnospiraceae bacterium]
MVYRLDRLEENGINPVTGCRYDNSWVIFILDNSGDYQQMCGNSNGCAYTVKTSRSRHKDWRMAVCDFAGYSEANGKNVVLVIDEADLISAKEFYKGHKYNEKFLRGDEPSVLVHSTPMENWHMIKHDGMLKSWKRLKAEGVISEGQPVGKMLGDPEDFSSYIMFGGGVAGEIVVNSKQKGNIVMDINAEYFTGARLYFDAEKIARDGLLTRDGCHIKVKDTLPLNPYLIWVATWESAGLKSQVSSPAGFAEKADRKFKDITGYDI